MWDVAHRFELGCEDAKKLTPWLQELDPKLQSVMKKFTLGMHHTNLRDVAEEMGVNFLEFCLFSETRFIEYSHRTYDHFISMYPVLITKIQRNMKDEHLTTDLLQDREHSETLLAQMIFILNLIFMREVSHLYAIFSKNSQAFDVLPFNCMTQFTKLKGSLSKASESFKRGESPIIETIHFRRDNKPFNLWEDFGNHTSLLISEQKFCGFDVLLPAEKGRVTRSVTSSASEAGDYSLLIKSYFSKYAEYIDVLLFHLHCRFIPWPQWLQSCNSCFNFLDPTPTEVRREKFISFLDEKHSPVPLNEQEKERLKAEYATLLVHAEELSDLKTVEAIWYKLLTEERYYENCKNVNEFALRFLTRTTNECTVESQVSAIESIEHSSRRLKHLMAERLSFISTNGPHPFASLKVIEDSLNKYFNGKPWHFVLSNSKYFTSKVVDRQMRESQNMANDLA